MKTLNYLFLTGLFLLFSCQKEQFTTDEAAAAGPVNGTVPFRSDTYAERDATLVNHFYEDLLAIQQRTHFYDSFFHDYGYFNWAGSLEYTTEDVGKVLVVPVKSSPTGIANGVFMYFDNGTDRRMKFVRRHVVEGKIAENRLAELSGDEVFAYRSFLLTDLKNPESRLFGYGYGVGKILSIFLLVVAVLAVAAAAGASTLPGRRNTIRCDFVKG